MRISSLFFVTLLIGCNQSSKDSEDLSTPEKVREAANRKRSENNLKQICVAFHHYDRKIWFSIWKKNYQNSAGCSMGISMLFLPMVP
jgi:hypothetical protein